MSFIKGMDVSMTKALEFHGASYYLEGQRDDLFRILKRCGTDMIRLRTWLNPYDDDGLPYGGGTNDLKTTAELAQRAMGSGMDYLLDIHYSDFWADPAKQVKPKAWKAFTGAVLANVVHRYTKDTLDYLTEKGLTPAIIQIGNEITNGFLWPDGHVNNLETMVLLLKSGISAARESCPLARIMLHLDFGTNSELYIKWFDNIQKFDVDYDIIGMSYYPHWNGSLNLLLNNMNLVSQRYQKDIIVAETSIGYTTDSLGCKGLVFTKELAKCTDFPATPEGQEQFIRELCTTIKSVNNNRGIGFFYWEPAWLPIPDCTWANPNGCAYMNDNVEAGNSMANQALFDENGEANCALRNLYLM